MSDIEPEDSVDLNSDDDNDDIEIQSDDDDDDDNDDDDNEDDYHCICSSLETGEPRVGKEIFRKRISGSGRCAIVDCTQ